MMIRMRREFPGSQNSIFPVFDTLLLLDRNVDLLTPLATQLTYEGLIDEIYGIQNSEYCRSRSLWSTGIVVHAFTIQPGWLPQCTLRETEVVCVRSVKVFPFSLGNRQNNSRGIYRFYVGLVTGWKAACKPLWYLVLGF